ncbi:MAG: biotin/lipoyl-containing protein, partial [Spirochaetales bacterium]
PEALAVEPMIHFSPMPGGALTANTQMMRDNGILDRYPEVIGAMREVVERGGFGTSVTPVSQFYFQQAFNNVMFGPWERMADGYGKMVLGYFGKTPVPPDPEIVARASELMELEPTTRNPIDINDEDPAKGIEAARATLRQHELEESDENIFIAATCREKGIQFLKGEARVQVRKVEPEAPAAGREAASGAGAAASDSYTVTVNGTAHEVRFEEAEVVVNGKRFSVDVAEALKAPTPQSGAATGVSEPVTAPFAGLVLRYAVEPGQRVAKGDPVIVIESMKMETTLSAPVAGTVTGFAVSVGDQFKSGEVLAQVLSE